MALNVTTDDLLSEAFRALGELTVHNRLLSQHIAQQDAAPVVSEALTEAEFAQRLADGEPTGG